MLGRLLVFMPYLVFFLSLFSFFHASELWSQPNIKNSNEIQRLKVEEILNKTKQEKGYVNKITVDLANKISLLEQVRNTLRKQQQDERQLKIDLVGLEHKLSLQRKRLKQYLLLCFKLGLLKNSANSANFKLNRSIAINLLGLREPFKFRQRINFSRYLLRANYQLLSETMELNYQIATKREALLVSLKEQKILEERLNLERQNLEKQKATKLLELEALQQSLTAKNQQLSSIKAKKEQELTVKALKQPKSPARALKAQIQRQRSTFVEAFPRMRGRLSPPLQQSIFSYQKTTGGLIFFAKKGTKISAIYAGKVVFSQALKDYGLLIIIDHGFGFMTLYAHNQALLKQVGEQVSAGDTIAMAGELPRDKKEGVYFELRQRGRVISALPWLLLKNSHSA